MATTLMSVTTTDTSAPPPPRTADSEPSHYTNSIHINNINGSGDLRANANEAQQKNDNDDDTPVLLNIFLIRKKRYRAFYNAGKLVWERYQSKKGKKKNSGNFVFHFMSCHVSHDITIFSKSHLVVAMILAMILI